MLAHLSYHCRTSCSPAASAAPENLSQREGPAASAREPLMAQQEALARSPSVHPLTGQVHGLFRLHQVQSQGLQVPEMLLQHRVLKTVTSVKTVITTTISKHDKETNKPSKDGSGARSAEENTPREQLRVWSQMLLLSFLQRRRNRSGIYCLIPQVTATARSEPRALSESPTWVQGPKFLSCPCCSPRYVGRDPD